MMPMASKLSWTLNRLRCMSAGELAYRLQKSVQSRVESLGIARRPLPAPAIPHAPRSWLSAPSRVPGAERLLAGAERILAGRFDVLGLQDVDLGMPPRWNRDPATGIEAPLVFGKRLDYRNEALVGNIKTLWEPSRHLELVTLAQAYAITGRADFSHGARTLIRSWIEQCPWPLGVHWSSSLELAIRLLNWSAAWNLLGGYASPLFEGDDGRAFRDQWLGSVYRHCRFIDGHLSRHSSANNHLLGEWMGLFVASLTWPCWPDSARWQARAREGFETEMLAQNAPDGVNREQAVYYHHEVADMMLIAGLAGRAHGVELSSACWQRLEAMMDFVLALLDAGGNVPAIGDADDALMLRLHDEPDWDPYRSLLAASAVLFSRGDFKSASKGFDAKSLWLLGDAGAQAYAALPAAAPVPRRRVFEEGGYAVLGSRFCSAREVRIVADAAPLGYLSIAAHGHADALAFTLSAGGRPLLVDPGTYAYHTERDWRDHFRGTAAHNTVRVDGVDQSEIGGNFMWLRKARATLHEVRLDASRDVWDASHDGYGRLPDPVRHRRRIEVDHEGGCIVVTDTLHCLGEHRAEVCWQFAEGLDVSIDGDEVRVAHAGTPALTMHMPGAGLKCRVLQGSTDPKGGWVSPGFGVKRAAPSIRWEGVLRGTTQWRTEIRLHATPAAWSPRAQEETAS
jgi:hypothetical protein